MLLGRGYYLNDIPGLKLVPQRYHLAVNPGSHAVMSDFAMNTVRKIDRCRPFGKRLNLSFRGKHIDFVREKLEFYTAYKILRIFYFLVDFQKLPYPGKTLRFTFVNLSSFFICPVSSNTFISYSIHLLRSYLNFHSLAKRTDNAGMK